MMDQITREMMIEHRAYTRVRSLVQKEIERLTEEIRLHTERARDNGKIKAEAAA